MNDRHTSRGRPLFEGFLAAWWLPVIAGFAASTLAFGGVGALLAGNVVRSLEPRLQGIATVVVFGTELESADAAVARAAEALSSRQEVGPVVILDPDFRDAEVGRLVSARVSLTRDVRLISMYDARRNVAFDKIAQSLRDHGLRVLIDDHRGWGSLLEHRALTAFLAVAAAIISILALLTFAAFRAGYDLMSRGRYRVDLMLRLGARPVWIGSIVCRSVFAATLGGALIGVLVIDLGILILLGSDDLTERLTPIAARASMLQIATTALWPPIVAAVAALMSVLGADRARTRDGGEP